ncbi:MAG: glutamate--tRNA ligase [Candidatus Omnitrophota bacterium]
MVKVRFAPSPTGYLHVGSARTALFNWLFARHSKGKFLLRIEDTDKARSKDEYLEEILDSLKWLGLSWDEEPYFQSKNFQKYAESAKKLVAEGKAYEHEGAVHLKMPREKIKIDDILHGDIEFDASTIKDQVLIKSDGSPAYNFACVLDDFAMGITHIIRGDDHISNTPKQIAMYEALGFAAPKFCHIPLILGTDRSRLSKRHGATSIREYRTDGILPQALVNYLTLLGWSPGEDKEIVSTDETIEKFELKDINKTAAVFDMDKLLWLNGQYIRSMDKETLTNSLKEILAKEGALKDNTDPEWFAKVVELYRERMARLNDIIALTDFLFKDEVAYDEKAVQKHFKENAKDILEKAVDGFKKLGAFDAASVEGCVRSLADQLGLKASKIIHPVRIAATGKSAGAGLFETLAVLGKEKTIKNISAALKNLVK